MTNPDLQPAPATEFTDWVEKDRGLGWTLNAVAYALFGATVRPEADYMVDGPYPALTPDGKHTWVPGRMAAITVNQTRGVDLINTTGSLNTELCRHHYGFWTITREGRLAPLTFSRPINVLDQKYVSIGKVTCVDPATRPEGDLLKLQRPGRMVAICELHMPKWMEGTFNSTPVRCGIAPT